MAREKKVKEEETVENNSKQESLNKALADIKKQFGNGAIMKLDKDTPIEEVEVIPTGSYGLDKALGVGGIPKGRIIECFGSEACLAYDTFIQYAIKTKEGKVQNHKGGTIENLYKRFNKIEQAGFGNYQRQQTINSDFFISSINEDNRVFMNRIVDVVDCGKHDCYKVTTKNGNILVSTLEHKYYTPNGFVELKDLKIGNTVFIHNKTPFKKQHKKIEYKEVYVKYHPKWKTRSIDKYIYYRNRVCNAVYEAYLNNMSYEEYIMCLNTKNKDFIDTLKTIPIGYDVHHIDENFKNDKLDNLVLLEKKEHYRLHALKNHNNLRFIVIEDEIVNVEFVGKIQTYDIKCLFPYNNYIANGVVVHNSGKTTMTLQIIAEAQKMGQTCAFIDAEHAMDLTYAQKIGVNVNDLLLAQPDCGEDALEIVETLVRSGSVGVIVVDSVAALVPRSEIEGNMGDAQMASQARLMSQALRKLTAITAKTNTIIIFINQTRQKIGVMFGDPTVTTGGNALKFYCSVRLDIRKIGQIKEGDSIIGNRVRIKVVKNKVAPPFQECEFDLLYGRGINRTGELIDVAVERGVVEKSGAWYAYNEHRLGQGRENSIQFLNEHTDIRSTIEDKLTYLKE